MNGIPRASAFLPLCLSAIRPLVSRSTSAHARSLADPECEQLEEDLATGISCGYIQTAIVSACTELALHANMSSTLPGIHVLSEYACPMGSEFIFI